MAIVKPRNQYQISREVIELYDRIETQRADGQCECHGDCGRSHKFWIHRRCPNHHGRPAVHGTDKMISLAVRHLNGDAKDFDEHNLLAMCQSCVRRHRTKTKAAQEKLAQRQAIEAMHEPLFDLVIPDTEVGAHLF